jgi:hypothetical protein
MKNQKNDILNDDHIIETALNILEKRITYNIKAPVLASPDDSKNYVKLQLSTYEHEVFACLFLDQRHRIITFEKLFRGTVKLHPYLTHHFHLILSRISRTKILKTYNICNSMVEQLFNINIH